jgi:hypothetical protein
MHELILLSLKCVYEKCASIVRRVRAFSVGGFKVSLKIFEKRRTSAGQEPLNTCSKGHFGPEKLNTVTSIPRPSRLHRGSCRSAGRTATHCPRVALIQMMGIYPRGLTRQGNHDPRGSHSGATSLAACANAQCLSLQTLAGGAHINPGAKLQKGSHLISIVHHSSQSP